MSQTSKHGAHQPTACVCTLVNLRKDRGETKAWEAEYQHFEMREETHPQLMHVAHRLPISLRCFQGLGRKVFSKWQVDLGACREKRFSPDVTWSLPYRPPWTLVAWRDQAVSTGSARPRCGQPCPHLVFSGEACRWRLLEALPAGQLPVCSQCDQ